MIRQLIPKNSIERAVVVFVFVLGLVFTIVVPPFQKPDEGFHFDRTLTLSKGYFFCSSNYINAPIKSGYTLLKQKIGRLGVAFSYEGKFPWRYFINNPFISAEENQKVPIGSSGSCGAPFIAYIPQAIGVIVGELIHLNSIYVFYLGRLFIFLASFSWLLYLIKIVPKQVKLVFLFVPMLPMTIFLLSSYSYDAIHIMIGLSIFCYLFRVIYQKQIVSNFQIAALFGLLGLFLFSKSGGYESFILLPLAINPQNIGKTKSTYFKKMFIAYFILVVIFVGGKILTTPNYMNGSRLSPIIPQAQIHYVLEKPLEFISIFVNTISLKNEFYIRGLVGIFGWLDWPLPPYLYYLYLGLAGLLITKVALDKNVKFKARQIVVFFLIIALTIIETHGLMYLVWTPVGRNVIEGIQGRYYIVLIPFLFIVVTYLIRKMTIVGFKAYILLLFLVIASIINSMYYRYFDYSKLLEHFEPITNVGEISQAVDIDPATGRSVIITVDSSKKLGAIVIYLDNKNGKVVDPYIVSIRDEQCVREYRREFIKLDKINDKYIIVPIKPIALTGKSSLCVVIQKYWKSSENNLSIFVDESGSPLIIPLNLR